MTLNVALLPRTLAVMGDSQTDARPYYAVRPTDMHPERVAAALRDLGVKIKARNFGISGDTTAGMLLRFDQMLEWENPDIGVIDGGVNDPAAQTLPTITPSASGGSIVASAGSLYFGLAFQMVNTSTGLRLTMPIASALMTAGSAGSIALGAVSLNALATGCDVYISPVGYATAAAAQAADTRTFRYATTLTGSAGSITAIPASGATRCPSASTQANIQAMIKCLKYGVVGWAVNSGKGGIVYATTSQLPANAPPGMRAVVLDDTSTTGGLAAIPNSADHATITGDYSGGAVQAVWERRTPQAGELGWGRVAVAGTAAFAGCCSRVLVYSTNYLNWTSGGDNYEPNSGKAFVSGTSTLDTVAGTPYALYAAVRVQQAAAAAAEGATYVDLYGFQAALILAGETTQGSNGWHAVANNQHHNAYGHHIKRRAAVPPIVAAGWVSALQ